MIRRIEEKVKKAIFDYGLIDEGDRLLVGLSGGKDSLALVDLLGRRSRIFNPRFEVVVAHVVMSNIPYASDIDYLRSRAEAYGFPFILHETRFDASTDRRKSPCFLCSWTRRKALFEIAKREGCGKIALGHHQDDILETLLMNLTHQGAFGTMPPRLKMDKFDMTLIRPLCLVKEAELAAMAQALGYRKQLKNCPYESGSNKIDMQGVYTILMLIVSNIFMTCAWYGHLKMKQQFSWFEHLPLIGVILFSWFLAFFEYCFQVPANRIGFRENGGPFSLIQLKVIQEVITLVVFVGFSTIAFKGESFKWNHALACLFLVAAVYLVFKK